METQSIKRKNRGKRAGITLGILLLLALVLCAVFLSGNYRALPEALQALEQPADGVAICRGADRIDFIPAEPRAGLVFYPGALVQFESYAPLMERFAERGILCVLLRMPANLAVLNPNAADGVPADYPEIARWYLGGHSLGGAVAANYLEKHTGSYEGLLLLAAYSIADLSKEDLRVLTVYGSEDGLLEMDKVESGRALLPADAGEEILPGGCHAFFGSYGAQKGDGVPQITNEQQMDQTADLVEAFCLENALDAAA